MIKRNLASRSTRSGLADSDIRWSWPNPQPDTGTGSADNATSGATTRVKVLHVITKLVDGAGGNTLVSAMGLDSERFEPWIAGAPGGPLWARAEAAGIPTVKLRHMRAPVSPVHDLLAVWELVRLIRRERFDIVHTHSSKAGFVGRVAAWLSRVPIVVHTIHGFSWHDYMSGRRRAVYVTLERVVRPATDAFLAVSPRVALEAVETDVAAAERTFVVPSAIELETIPTEPDPNVREELGVPAAVPIVGTVGRLDFQKAPVDFVRMAALVREALPETRFVWVGEGELLEQARAEARRIGVDVLFTGYVPNAPRVASAFDVYVVSSLYEGVGRAMCEALASGRPVVATAVNGVGDVVDNGETGLLARPRAAEDLAEKVIWLLDHKADARRMGLAAAERVRRLFHPSLMCSLIERCYVDLLREAGADCDHGSGRRGRPAAG